MYFFWFRKLTLKMANGILRRKTPELRKNKFEIYVLRPLFPTIMFLIGLYVNFQQKKLAFYLFVFLLLVANLVFSFNLSFHGTLYFIHASFHIMNFFTNNNLKLDKFMCMSNLCSFGVLA